MLYLSELKSLPQAILIYRACLLRAGANDPNALSILEFVNDRASSLRSLESEVQPLEEFLFAFFKSVLPTLQLALGPSATFPWKLLNIADKPEVSIPNEVFFRPNYMILIHLSEICEAFLIFGTLWLHRLPEIAFVLDGWVLAHSCCLYIHFYGTANLELKPMIQSMKKQKKIDLDLSFLDLGDIALSRHRANQALKWHWLSLLLRDYLSACEVDPVIVCSDWGLGLALLGFTSFELCNGFKLHQARPSPEKAGGQWWDPRELTEMLFHFVKVNALISTNISDLKRFIVYNLREFDSHFLDTVVHSYLLPVEIFGNLETLKHGLRLIDIEEYDAGIPIDLSPCASLADLIAVDFNAYGVGHGVLHLTTVMQFICGFSLRLKFYQ
jgi:hypothetical protein